jgi:hypothetical protein
MRRRKDWTPLLSQKTLLRAIVQDLDQLAFPQQAHREGYTRYVHNKLKNILCLNMRRLNRSLRIIANYCTLFVCVCLFVLILYCFLDYRIYLSDLSGLYKSILNYVRLISEMTDG